MKWWTSNFKSKKKSTFQNNSDQTSHSSRKTTARFTGNFDYDMQLIKQEIAHNSDVHIREFNIARTSTRAAIIFVDGLSDKDLIEKHILNSLMVDFCEEHERETPNTSNCFSKELIINQVLTLSEVSEIHTIHDFLSKVLTGSTALVIDQSTDVFILGTTKENSRNIEEPVSEALVRGPRVGFTESLRENTALLRRHGENRNLTITNYQVGKHAIKKVSIAYMKDIVEPELLEEIKKRIQKIDIDHVPESGYIEQLIEDNFLSPFPQVQSTERPDRVISSIMEGRVAILLDGTPFALIAPVTFGMLLQSPEDYYERWIQGSFFRLIRFAAALVTLFAPALYISFISFHPGLIPSKLAITITGTREGVPFPSLIEALLMEIAIETLREAGLRLPKPIGPAMGIVGGLIIGEAAVQAGIVSNMMVIIVAITAIASFAIPNYSAGIPLRILRFVAMFFAAVFGLYGVILFFLLLSSHLVKLKSFGVPYASPAVPYRLSEWKDFMVRMPLQMLKRRPKMMHTKDPIRKG